ncbi:transporter substrate-binding protein, partial [Pseudomonas viridiflava]|uniref:transporter substrate-binding protein n=1 Tax=Pseudomonas viridiflava TaxID=33069 RepID=UPI000F06F41D
MYYEGFEYSRNIIYTGATPNHNAVPLGNYMFEHFGNRVLMIGSEYVYPYETNRLMSDLLYERGGQKLGEYYLPLKNARPEDFARLMIKARELKPDVVLMDVKMPGIGGLEATRKLLRSHPDIKVVAVTVCEEDPFPTRLLQAG